MPRLDDFGQGLARAVGTGDVRALRELYAPGATLEAHLPGRSILVRGRGSILEELSSWAPAATRVLSERRSRGGLVVRVESRRPVPHGVERRRHLVQLARGGVARHVVYPERPRVAELPELPEVSDGAAADVVGRVRERVALEPGISGCLVERWRLDHGRVVFAKHLRPADSWLMRASADRGREAELFRSGVLGRLAGVVDHAVIGAASEPGGWLLLSEDRSDALGRRLRTAPARRRILEAAASVHRRLAGERVPGACPLDVRLRTFSPATAAAEAEGSDLAPKVIGRGWELFAEFAPPEVGAAIAELAERPWPLVRALEELPGALVHGDLRPANVGWSVPPVFVDWGLALVAPMAFEGGWWLFNAGWRGAASLDAMLEEVRAGMGLGDPALGLGLLATLVQAAGYFGFEVAQSPDPAARRRAREGLGWWSARARAALQRLSP